MAVNEVAVIGGGQMGSGIAQLGVVAGLTVYLVDTDPKALAREPILYPPTSVGSSPRIKFLRSTAPAAADIGFDKGSYFLAEVTPAGWAEGECKGKAGWFPVAYVERRHNVPTNKVVPEVF